MANNEVRNGLVIREYSDYSNAGYPQRRFENISDGISIKSDYGIRDYNSFRPTDATSQNMEEIIMNR